VPSFPPHAAVGAELQQMPVDCEGQSRHVSAGSDANCT
jgi:hypothetical protein